MSVYEAKIFWENDKTTMIKIKVKVPDNSSILPYLGRKAQTYRNGDSRIKVISIKRITCMGCIEDAPGQLAHMDPGGCLEKTEESESL